MNHFWTSMLLVSSISLGALCQAEDKATTAVGSAGAGSSKPLPDANARDKFSQKYADEDVKHPPIKGGILFAGSSSIEKWKTLGADFKPLLVLNRGVGGSMISDWIKFEPKVVAYDPKTIVFYCGDNDIASGKPVAKVVQDFKDFSNLVHTSLPEARIIYISMKPSPKRTKNQKEEEAANAAINELAKSTTFIRYVDVRTSMLKDGLPIVDLFGRDQLHMNERGYAIWIELLKPYLAGGKNAPTVP